MQDIMYEKDLMSLWFDSQEEINYNQKTILLKKLGSLEACFYAKKRSFLLYVKINRPALISPIGLQKEAKPSLRSATVTCEI